MSPLAQKIEALLFVSGEAVSKHELLSLLQISSAEELTAALEELRTELSSHGLSLISTETHVQLTTNPSVKDFLADFQRQEERPLSPAAAETLSIIAYRGPLSRYDVSALRGVDSRNSIQSLLRRGVIQQVQSAGSTPFYDVTEDFLKSLGITCKEDLPEYNQLASQEDINRVLKDV